MMTKFFVRLLLLSSLTRLTTIPQAQPIGSYRGIGLKFQVETLTYKQEKIVSILEIHL